MYFNLLYISSDGMIEEMYDDMIEEICDDMIEENYDDFKRKVVMI